eukprot:528-Eustigmatos_ZCMA.PRE.1
MDVAAVHLPSASPACGKWLIKARKACCCVGSRSSEQSPPLPTQALIIHVRHNSEALAVERPAQ